jgi:predicted component of type VI protein secretion system
MSDDPSTRELVLRALAEASIHPVLRTLGGPHTGASLVLDQQGRRYVIGRSRTCDLSLSDDGDVSREHVEVRLDGELVAVRDLRTRHGTWLSGHRLEPDRSARWSYGMLLRVGASEIELVPPATRRVQDLVRAADAAAKKEEAPVADGDDAARADAVSEEEPSAPLSIQAFSAPIANVPVPVDPPASPVGKSRVYAIVVAAAGLLLVLTLVAIVALLVSFC